MASNLRSKPIEGYVLDSAGNTLTNAQIIVKQQTPEGSLSVDTVKSDDSGYFITKPIPSGTYSIYESGIVVSKVIHLPDQSSIQSYKAAPENYNIDSIESFSTLVGNGELNKFRAYLQIEASEIDISQYGSTFPIYDFNITTNTNIGESGDELYHLAGFLKLSSDSRITTTRFDIEYYFPITATSSIYKRIRWAGVSSIRFTEDSKLVIPLDYFSIVLNSPRIIDPPDSDYTDGEVLSTGTFEKMTLTYTSDVNKLLPRLKDGDILTVLTKETNGPGQPETPWYGIVIDVGTNTIELEKWQSSRFTSTVDPGTSGVFAARVSVYDGMFAGIFEINESANERFSVVENISAQNNGTELYNYNNRYIT